MDRPLVSSWLHMHSGARPENLIAVVSDHSPLVLNTCGHRAYGGSRPFRFENKWLREPDFNYMFQAAGNSQLEPLFYISYQLVLTR